MSASDIPGKQAEHNQDGGQSEQDDNKDIVWQIKRGAAHGLIRFGIGQSGSLRKGAHRPARRC